MGLEGPAALAHHLFLEEPFKPRPMQIHFADRDLDQAWVSGFFLCFVARALGLLSRHSVETVPIL